MVSTWFIIILTSIWKGEKKLAYGKKLETYYSTFFPYSKEMQQLAHWPKLNNTLYDGWYCKMSIDYFILAPSSLLQIYFLLGKDDWDAANLAHI
jgi:hypothetical protein